MTIRTGRLVAAASAFALTGAFWAATPASAADPVIVNLVDFNDFHGRIDSTTVQWAGTVKQLEADAPAGQSLLLSAGDNIGASLFASSVQQDDPTLDVLNALDVDATTVGNHEFDQGTDDLIDRVVPRSEHPILGANVQQADGSPLLDASTTFDVGGVTVAVIGAVTQETPSLVSPDGIAGLEFAEPVAAVNAEVERLEALPEAERPDVYVASYHEGGPDATLTYDQQVATSPVFARMAQETSPEVDAIFMGHTHQKYTYDAPVPGESGRTRPIVQTGNYGENVGQIKLSVDPDTGDVVTYSQRVVARSTATEASLIGTYPDLAAVQKIRDDAVAYAAEVGQVEKGRITADITTAYTANGTTRDDRASESTLGNLVADALLSKVSAEPAGADLALVNPGGLRAELRYAAQAGVPGDADGVTTYAELNSVLPFANNLVSVDLSGESVKKLFEQQWQRDAAGNVPSRPYLQLGTSDNVSYTFDPTRPEGERVTSLRIDGEPIDPAQRYKVATFSFLAAGGDNFRAFKEGTVTDTGLVDRDGWIEYFEENSPISPDFARHAVQVEGLATEYAEGDTVSFTLPKLDLTSLGSPANTTVKATLVQGDESYPLGDFPVSAGAATVSAALPDGASGEATIKIEVDPSGTTALLEPITIEKDAADAKLQVVTLPQVKQGSWSLIGGRLSGPEGVPTGTVTITTGDTKIGSGKLEKRGYFGALIDTRKLPVGQHTLTVAYSGDDVYGPVEKDVTITVKKGRR